MPALTTNFSWYLPIVGGDTDVWGGYLDSNWSSIDGLLRRSINNFIGSTSPTEAQTGTIWLNNTTNPYILSIYDGANWVAIGTLDATTHSFTASGATGSYIGDMKYSAQSASHGSWLLCNGQSLSTTTYSALFAVIGYAFGGSGASFSAPDLRGQVPGAIGMGSYTGASTRTQGQFVGEETHILTIPEIPSHTHGLPGNSITPGGVNFTALNPNIAPAGAVTGATGGGGAHNNMQPTLFVGNFFIYSGV